MQRSDKLLFTQKCYLVEKYVQMLYSIIFKGAVMQIEKALINHRLRVRKVHASFTFQLFIISQ